MASPSFTSPLQTILVHAEGEALADLGVANAEADRQSLLIKYYNGNLLLRSENSRTWPRQEERRSSHSESAGCLATSNALGAQDNNVPYRTMVLDGAIPNTGLGVIRCNREAKNEKDTKSIIMKNAMPNHGSGCHKEVAPSMEHSASMGPRRRKCKDDTQRTERLTCKVGVATADAACIRANRDGDCWWSRNERWPLRPCARPFHFHYVQNVVPGSLSTPKAIKAT